jgi:hypothetical protein
MDVFGPLAMAYSEVTRTIRPTNWKVPEAQHDISDGESPNFRMDAAVEDNQL